MNKPITRITRSKPLSRGEQIAKTPSTKNHLDVEGFEDIVRDVSEIAEINRQIDSGDFGHGGSDFGGFGYE